MNAKNNIYFMIEDEIKRATITYKLFINTIYNT